MGLTFIWYNNPDWYPLDFVEKNIHIDLSQVTKVQFRLSLKIAIYHGVYSL